MDEPEIRRAVPGRPAGLPALTGPGTDRLAGRLAGAPA